MHVLNWFYAKKLVSILVLVSFMQYRGTITSNEMNYFPRFQSRADGRRRLLCLFIHCMELAFDCPWVFKVISINGSLFVLRSILGRAVVGTDSVLQLINMSEEF